MRGVGHWGEGGGLDGGGFLGGGVGGCGGAGYFGGVEAAEFAQPAADGAWVDGAADGGEEVGGGGFAAGGADGGGVVVPAGSFFGAFPGVDGGGFGVLAVEGGEDVELGGVEGCFGGSALLGGADGFGSVVLGLVHG